MKGMIGEGLLGKGIHPYPCIECLVRVCCTRFCDNYIFHFRMLSYKEAKKAYEEGNKSYEELKKVYNRLKVKSLKSFKLEETEE